MGLVYAYLAAWVLGGVLLGGRVLLADRDDDAGVQPQPETQPQPEGEGPTHAGAAGVGARGSRIASAAAAALLGFGLFGIVAEGFGLVAKPWTVAVALVGAILASALRYALVRKRRESSEPPPNPPVAASGESNP